MRVAVAIPAYDAAHSVGSVVMRARAVIEDVLVIEGAGEPHSLRTVGISQRGFFLELLSGRKAASCCSG